MSEQAGDDGYRTRLQCLNTGASMALSVTFVIGLLSTILVALAADAWRWTAEACVWATAAAWTCSAFLASSYLSFGASSIARGGTQAVVE